MPRTLQTCTAVDEAHVCEPGVQTGLTHDPALHERPAGQPCEVYPRPSALQVCETVLVAQDREPGVQVHATHPPLEHEVPDGHVLVV